MPGRVPEQKRIERLKSAPRLLLYAVSSRVVSVAQGERWRFKMTPEGDLEAGEEVTLAEQAAAFGNERRTQLEDRSPGSGHGCG